MGQLESNPQKRLGQGEADSAPVELGDSKPSKGGRSQQRLTLDLTQIKAEQLALTPEQTHYLRRVLRLRDDDGFIAQDGYGNQWQACLGPGQQQARLLEKLPVLDQGVALTLVAALPKKGFDDVVRQATELGVTAIQPLISERTLLKPSPQKMTRWQRIAQEASEQSERGIVPQIYTPALSMDWLNRKSSEGLVCFCVARNAQTSLLSCLQGFLVAAPQASITVVIGPEGGWTSEEIAVATSNQYKIVSLGSAVLRATTASIVALAIVTAIKEALT